MSALTPFGRGVESLYTATQLGRVGIQKIGALGRVGGTITCGSPLGIFSPQLADRKVMNQTDRSTQMAMAVMDDACADAGLVDTAASHRIGVFVGSTFGGIEFSESELYSQFFLSAKKVSAYQAIAWFYAATQGQWTIARKLHGFSKSYVSSSNGGLQGLIMGAVALMRGHCDTAVICASEALITPFYLAILECTGMYSRVAEPASSYLPFSGFDTGTVPAESAVALVIERRSTAVARGATILAELTGFSNHSSSSSTRSYDVACSEQAADVALTNHTIVFPHAGARNCGDEQEAAALATHFGGCHSVAVPKTLIGDCLSAAGLLDVVWAIGFMQGRCGDVSQYVPQRFKNELGTHREYHRATILAKDFYNTVTAVSLMHNNN